MAWTEITRGKYKRDEQRYESDTAAAEWALIEPHMPPPAPRGRTREVSLRDVVNAIFYIAQSGCQWRMLPKDFPPYGSVSIRATVPVRYPASSSPPPPYTHTERNRQFQASQGCSRTASAPGTTQNAPGPPTDQSSYSVEGGHIGRWRRMERQPDRRRRRHQHRHGGANPPTIGGRRL